MTETPSAALQGHRWLKLGLALSLAVNLAVAGVVAGAVLRDQGDGPARHTVVRDLSFGPFSAALTRDQRRALVQAFASRGEALGDLRAQMRDDLAAVAETLRRTPFDGDAFRAAIETQSERSAARAQAGRDALIGLVLDMSEAERATFAENLEQGLARRGPERLRPRE